MKKGGGMSSFTLTDAELTKWEHEITTSASKFVRSLESERIERLITEVKRLRGPAPLPADCEIRQHINGDVALCDATDDAPLLRIGFYNEHNTLTDAQKHEVGQQMIATFLKWKDGAGLQ